MSRRSIQEAHDGQDAMLTKLRLLTSRAMVDAAFEVHAAGHVFVDAATETPRRTLDDVRRAGDELWRARHRFVSLGKRTVGLPGRQSRVTEARGRTVPRSQTPSLR